MGFITSPLEFSDSECKPRALTRSGEDAPLQPEDHSNAEQEDDPNSSVSSAVINRAADDEDGEHSQDGHKDAALDPGLSVEPLTKG